MQLQDPQKQKDFLKKYSEVNRKMEEEQAASLSFKYGIPYINLTGFPIGLEAIGTLAKEQAQDAETIVFYKDGVDIRIGTANPTNPLLSKIVGELEQHKLQVQKYYISRSSLNQAMLLYAKVVQPKEITPEELQVKFENDYVQRFKALEGGGPVLSATEILEILLGAASQSKASDLHIEPEENFVKIRLRLDGVLSDVGHMAKQYQKAVVSRIKILSKLKLNVEDRPQDGRFSYVLSGKPTDVRVSVLPSAYGEGVVMRILSNSAVSLKYDQLGLTGQSYDLVKRELQKPNGMIVTTGPTGSGKTTTLYAFLNLLNEPGVKIITLEDPVEYKLEGITQTPVTPALGFAAGLRAILRQDPDVIMIGEIRDAETADTALQAALTGHVVLSTLHTNDASGAIPRLINMGIKPFVIAPALNAIIAQRLVRRLCPDCKTEVKPDPFTLDRVKKNLAEIPKSSGVDVPKELKFFHSTGCKSCNGTAYQGRIGIYEVIVKNERLDKLIMSGAPSSEIKKAVVEDGMVTMVQDGLLKASQGITDIEEVFRVTQE